MSAYRNMWMNFPGMDLPEEVEVLAYVRPDYFKVAPLFTDTAVEVHRSRLFLNPEGQRHTYRDRTGFTWKA